MAEFRLTFGTYVVASTLSVLALLLRTWYVHEELYTVVAVLTTQKVALAILYNFAFMLVVGFGKVVLHVLLGQLRDLEVEQVLDSGRGFLLDTVLFLVLSSPTLDGADVSTYALAKFLLLVVALKTAHLVVQIRGATYLLKSEGVRGVYVLSEEVFCLLDAGYFSEIECYRRRRLLLNSGWTIIRAEDTRSYQNK